MEKQTFSKRIQTIMGERTPKEYTGGKWHGKSYNHICIAKEYNFIDRKVPIKCDIKGNYFGDNKLIKYHEGAAHLNSSQVVCINFFKKFFEKQAWESILIDTLKAVGVPLSCDKIQAAIFEYEPDAKERTNFDFYMVLENGSKVSMEIKYTEAEFGGISIDRNDPDKYTRKWDEIYKKMVDECPYMQCNEEMFYKHYQINRNICYAKANDIVLFITPRSNDAAQLIKGREYIDAFTLNNPNIRNLYWEELLDALMVNVKTDKELTDYYCKFKDKYIDIL